MGNPEKGLWCSKDMGPLNYVPANKIKTKNLKREENSEQIEKRITGKPTKDLEADTDIDAKKKESNEIPVMKEETTPESSDDFLFQNNKE